MGIQRIDPTQRESQTVLNVPQASGRNPIAEGFGDIGAGLKHGSDLVLNAMQEETETAHKSQLNELIDASNKITLEHSQKLGVDSYDTGKAIDAFKATYNKINEKAVGTIQKNLLKEAYGKYAVDLKHQIENHTAKERQKVSFHADETHVSVLSDSLGLKFESDDTVWDDALLGLKVAKMDQLNKLGLEHDDKVAEINKLESHAIVNRVLSLVSTGSKSRAKAVFDKYEKGIVDPKESLEIKKLVTKEADNELGHLKAYSMKDKIVSGEHSLWDLTQILRNDDDLKNNPDALDYAQKTLEHDFHVAAQHRAGAALNLNLELDTKIQKEREKTGSVSMQFIENQSEWQQIVKLNTPETKKLMTDIKHYVTEENIQRQKAINEKRREQHEQAKKDAEELRQRQQASYTHYATRPNLADMPDTYILDLRKELGDKYTAQLKHDRDMARKNQNYGGEAKYNKHLLSTKMGEADLKFDDNPGHNKSKDFKTTAKIIDKFTKLSQFKTQAKGGPLSLQEQEQTAKEVLREVQVEGLFGTKTVKQYEVDNPYKIRVKGFSAEDTKTVIDFLGGAGIPITLENVEAGLVEYKKGVSQTRVQRPAATPPPQRPSQNAQPAAGYVTKEEQAAQAKGAAARKIMEQATAHDKEAIAKSDKVKAAKRKTPRDEYEESKRNKPDQHISAKTQDGKRVRAPISATIMDSAGNIVYKGK